MITLLLTIFLAFSQPTVTVQASCLNQQFRVVASESGGWSFVTGGGGVRFVGICDDTQIVRHSALLIFHGVAFGQAAHLLLYCEDNGLEGDRLYPILLLDTGEGQGWPYGQGEPAFPLPGETDAVAISPEE